MKKKEASARIKINHLLKEAGWRFFDDENGPANIQLEPNVKMSKADLTGLGENFDRVKNGFVDFLLLDDKGKPFIVLEAKAEDKDPLVGKEQAREYAKSLYLKYVILSNGNQHYFWNIYKGNPQLITAFPGYESIRESKAMNADPAKLYSEEIGADYIAVIKNPRYMEAPEYINPETRQKFLYDNGLRFLRQYQINALKALQESVRHGNQRFLFEMATGTGKTLTSVGNAVKQFRGGSHQLAAEIGRVVQTCTTVGPLRNSASVVVNVNWTVIDALVAVLSVIADVQCQAVRDQSLVRELEYQTVSHLLDDDPSFIIRIRTGKYLSFGQAVGFRAIGVDLLHPAGFQSPGVVDENLSVYTEFLI